MPKTVLITGWTGNVGAAALPRLRKRHPDWHLIGVGRTSPQRETMPDVVEVADLGEETALASVFSRHPIDLVLHIAHISFTPRILRLCDANQVTDAVCVHTTGMYSKYEAYSGGYKRIEAGLQEEPPLFTRYTILRPTMIYGNMGPTRDQNLHKLIGHLSQARFFPLFGAGQGKMQPIHVEDLADALVACVEDPRTRGKAYEVSGGTILTYRQLLQTVCAQLGRCPRFVTIPSGVAVLLAEAYEKVSAHPRITREQVVRLSEDKAFSHEEAARDFGFAPRTFADGIAQEIAQMRRDGWITTNTDNVQKAAA